MTSLGAILISIILFCTGILVLITKRNVLVVLLGLELIFNAANINFVAFNGYWISKGVGGQVMALFVIAIVAAELALALAILLKAIKAFGSSNIDEFSQLSD
jgi:NADH:ubiquinone oxidoreductase subunit K